MAQGGPSGWVDAPERLISVLGALMIAQSLLGLSLPDQYRDADWIRATWLGNDWVTLAGAVPLLWTGKQAAARGSARGMLVMLGMVWYAVYNYAFYLFGAALNVFFPLYVVIFALAIVTLTVALSQLDAAAVARCFDPTTPVRTVGAYLAIVGIGLGCVWLGMWGAYAFAGRSTPIEPEVFKVVAALDLSLMVPALAAGGVMLWQRQPWGFLIASIAGVQGALYLVLLSVNTGIAITRGRSDGPGELPIWGPLALFTGMAAIALLRSASGRLAPPSSIVRANLTLQAEARQTGHETGQSRCTR